MQTSNKNLDPAEEKTILNQFYLVITDLTTLAETKSFLTSFMTPTERLVFAKRLAIAWLLEQGKSYEEITKSLKVSSATISSVAEMRQTPGMQLAYQRLTVGDWFRRLKKAIRFWK